MSQLITNKGVCRTALATQGLLDIAWYIWDVITLLKRVSLKPKKITGTTSPIQKILFTVFHVLRPQNKFYLEGTNIYIYTNIETLWLTLVKIHKHVERLSMTQLVLVSEAQSSGFVPVYNLVEMFARWRNGILIQIIFCFRLFFNKILLCLY